MRHRRRPRARIYRPIGPDRPQRPDRTRQPGEATPPRLSGRLDPAARADLRERLVAAIRNSTGPDRQCHLSIHTLTARVRADQANVRRELQAMRRAGIIDRFQRENGETATVFLAPGE